MSSPGGAACEGAGLRWVGNEAESEAAYGSGGGMKGSHFEGGLAIVFVRDSRDFESEVVAPEMDKNLVEVTARKRR